jgi:tetratricopeptide (TPR) repeat protein
MSSVTLGRFPEAVVLGEQVQALTNQQKYADVIPLAQRLVEITRSDPGPQSADHVAALDQLAVAYEVLGKYEETEPLFRSALAIREHMLPSSHPDIGLAHNRLANALNILGRHKEAAEHYRSMMAIMEAARGPEHDDAFWPPSEPILRIETGMHNAPIWRIDVDAHCRLMLTGSLDKTARLWELPTDQGSEPRLVQVLRVPSGSGHDGEVHAVALSPDLRLVAVGAWNREFDHYVYIFDTKTGKLIRRLDKLDSTIQELRFSRDGRFLAAMLHGQEGMRAWETASWSLVGQDRDYGGESYGGVFDGAGNLYTVAYDGFMRRYGSDFKLEAKSRTLGGRQPQSVAVHPKGELVAVGYDDRRAVDVYRTHDLAHVFDADTRGTNLDLPMVAWSADGQQLYAGGSYNNGVDRAVRIWDGEGHGPGRDVFVARDTVMQLRPCDNAIAVATQDPAFGLISFAGKKLLWHEGNTTDMRNKVGGSFLVSSDGSKISFGLGRGGQKPILFDLVATHLADRFDFLVTHLADPRTTTGLSPDVDALKLTDWQDEFSPKLAGNPIRLDRYERSRSVAIAPGADRFVLGAEWSLRAYDNTGKLVWRKPVPGTAWGVNITQDNRFVLVAYGDGTIRWHRLSDGGEVLALFVHKKTREWVLWIPQGYYASSPRGDEYIGWHLNKGWEQAGDFVTAKRLKQHLYRPEIIKRAFELADAEAAVREAGLGDFKIADLAKRVPPQFRIIDPRDKAHANRSPVAVHVEVTSADDLITAFDVKVNGREVTPRTVRDLRRGAVLAEPPVLNVPLEKGENRIQVTARNDVGETVNELMVYLDREGLLDKKGRLFVLAVGVDNYSKLGIGSALQYAGADARLIVDTLREKAGPLHTEVKSKLLISGGDTPPTKANIEDALTLFNEAQAEDTVILFLAGHGVNEGADYLFMPEDAQRMESGKWRPSSVVRWHVLQNALQQAHGNRIMFVDTCHALGAFSPRLVKDAFDANIVVFSATDHQSLAQEHKELGHGVFSYALSQGLKGAAKTKKGEVSLLQLCQFVSDEVKRLTNDEQEPTFSLSQVKNFLLAAP